MGPDHYLPFVVMARARNWSFTKTTWITILCGIGHVGSSVILGFIGIALGMALSKLSFIESFRGNLAGWALIAFGLVYAVWGFRRAYKKHPHTHTHLIGPHAGITHLHDHDKAHSHDHSEVEKVNITPWILFTVFVLGPCEPLIPILMYPAAHSSALAVALVAGVFSIITITTMVTVVTVSSLGIKLLPLKKLERYTHAIAGLTIAVCGIAIQFLGL